MKITVYTKNNCMQCEMTKQILNRKGLPFEAINVQEVDEIEVEIDGVVVKKNAIDYIKENLGFSAMPVVVAEGKEVFAGFRPDLLEELGE